MAAPIDSHVFDVPGFVDFSRGYPVGVNVKIFSSYPSELGWYAEYVRKDSEGELVYVGPFRTKEDAYTSGKEDSEFEGVICVTRINVLTPTPTSPT